MKKTIITILSLTLSAALFAQDEGTTMSYMSDAYTWAQNEYYGSARAMGMGNAVTAVGGDLGMIGINPAGSAVAPYSQITVTPGCSVGISTSQGLETYDGNSYLGTGIKSTKVRVAMPNLGVSLAFNTGNIGGLKRATFAFTANTVTNFNDYIQGAGRAKAGSSTLAGSLAAGMQGIPYDNWSILQQLAWGNNLVGQYDELFPGTLFGVTEVPLVDGTAELAGDLQQRYNYSRKGSKVDYALNLGFNISDIVFLGMNLGINTLDYSYSESYSENAIESGLFPSGFSALTRGYTYSTSGYGIYAKFGFITTPVAGLRIGAAIETPTSYTLSEGYTNSVSCSYSGVKKDESDKVSDVRTGLVTPWRFNIGLAYTFGQYVILSADYERADYSRTRFVAKFDDDISWFNNINNQIKGLGTYNIGNLGESHSFRVGIEAKPVSVLALRAGYNFVSDGSRFTDETGSIMVAHNQNINFGIGYNSRGSFFADLALRYAFRPDAEIQVYGDYDNRGTGAAYRFIGGPQIQAKRNQMMVSATLGWRF